MTLEQRVRELTAGWPTPIPRCRPCGTGAELRGRALHHRVKNDLQVVVSLLDWHGQELQDPCARAVFEACQGRIRAIALVHEWLYRARDGDHLDLGQYLGQLARPLFGAYGVDRERIQLTLQADAVSVAADTAIPCGLLVHEVLVNCVQRLTHPTPRGGHDHPAGRPAEQATLTIRDTGLGWPGHGAVGAAEEFGLHLIRALTEQLQGTLTFTREGGTGVTLRFPSDQAESGGDRSESPDHVMGAPGPGDGPSMAGASVDGRGGRAQVPPDSPRARPARCAPRSAYRYRPTEITGIDARARMCRAASIHPSPRVSRCPSRTASGWSVGLGHRVLA